MNTTTQTVENGSDDDRRIDDGRIHRAMTEDLSLAVVAPGQYAVTHDGQRYDVDVHTATCDCPDATYRDVACKHLLAAATFHAYLSAGNSRFVARTLAALGEFGCAHDVRGCAGPVTLGERAIPCEGCLSVTPGHWTVWNRLVNHETVAPDYLPTAESALVADMNADTGTDADAESALVADGGTETETDADSDTTGRNDVEQSADDGPVIVTDGGVDVEDGESGMGPDSDDESGTELAKPFTVTASGPVDYCRHVGEGMFETFEIEVEIERAITTAEEFHRFFELHESGEPVADAVEILTEERSGYAFDEDDLSEWTIQIDGPVVAYQSAAYEFSIHDVIPWTDYSRLAKNCVSCYLFGPGARIAQLDAQREGSGSIENYVRDFADELETDR